MDEAIERFSRLLEQNPGNHLARFSLAKHLFEEGRFEEAREHFQHALKAKADWMMARILLGKCHLALGDKTAARESFQQGLELAVAQRHEGPQMEMETMLNELS